MLVTTAIAHAGVLSALQGQVTQVGDPTQPPAAIPQSPSAEPADNKPDPIAELDGFVRFITGSNEPEVRQLGASKLLQDRSPAAVERLAGVLVEPNGLAAKMAVCMSIAQFEKPPPALADHLFELLGDKRPELRDAASSALRRFERGEVIARLRSLALDAGHSTVRRAAATRALGNWGDELQAVEGLIAIFTGDEPALRKATTTALREATGLFFADKDQATLWWKRHKNVSDTQWLRTRNGQLRDQLKEVSNDRANLTRQLVEVLRDLHVRTPEDERPALLLQFLQHARPAVRTFALDMVNVRITDRKEIGPDIKTRLGALIDDPDESVRRSAANIVGDLRLTEYVETLLAALANEGVASVRAVQVRALGELDDSRAIPAIIMRLDDRDPAVVSEAARGLGNLVARAKDRSEDVAPVSKALVDRFSTLAIGDEETREAFLVALGHIGSNAFVEIFRGELAADRCPRIRQAAIRALTKSGQPTVANDIRPLLTAAESRVRLAAVEGLATCGRDDVDLAALAERLDSPAEPDQTVRERAWEGYKSIAQRLSVVDQIAVAAGFETPGNATDQRRRLGILKGAEPRFAELDVESRTHAIEGMAEARVDLGEYAAAARRFDQAARLLTDRKSERFGELAGRAVEMFLKSGDDEKALTQIDDYSAENAGEATQLGERLRSLLLVEIDRRLDAGDHAAGSQLIGAALPRARAGQAFGAELAARRNRADELAKAART
ncbi:MAG: HEAT repeat domain-containing protein, partial [Planctomycetota bacterium]|nr:HEAT repeat domain-containing protein [Planctomycetota bacterium]